MGIEQIPIIDKKDNKSEEEVMTEIREELKKTRETKVEIPDKDEAKKEDEETGKLDLDDDQAEITYDRDGSYHIKRKSKYN